MPLFNIIIKLIEISLKFRIKTTILRHDKFLKNCCVQLINEQKGRCDQRTCYIICNHEENYFNNCNSFQCFQS